LFDSFLQNIRKCYDIEIYVFKKIIPEVIFLALQAMDRRWEQKRTEGYVIVFIYYTLPFPRCGIGYNGKCPKNITDQ
jgi:hypothetical protein